MRKAMAHKSWQIWQLKGESKPPDWGKNLLTFLFWKQVDPSCKPMKREKAKAWDASCVQDSTMVEQCFWGHNSIFFIGVERAIKGHGNVSEQQGKYFFMVGAGANSHLGLPGQKGKFRVFLLSYHALPLTTDLLQSCKWAPLYLGGDLGRAEEAAGVRDVNRYLGK